MSAAAIPFQRARWRMGIEARALVVVTAVLVAFGLAVVYSASAYEAMYKHMSAYFLVRQLAGVAAGTALFVIAAKVDIEYWRKAAWPLVCLALLTMIAVLLPHMHAIFGSRRFLFGSSIQPSEFAKLAVVVWSAMLVEKKGEDGLRRLSKGLVPFLIVVGALDLLAVMEPDYSVALHLTLLAAVVLYAGGARIGHFVFLSFFSIPVLWAVIQSKDYARERVVAFLNPAAAASHDKIYQLTQSLVAAGSGGFFGVGFGHGRQQMGYVQFPYTDFIGSVIAEEWGFVGLTGVTLMFALYGWLGFRIAAQAKNKFQQLVAIGITVNVILTAYLHLGVVIGLLPTTGLTLPFISYGRSNLLITFVMTAILCNIGSQRDGTQGSGLPGNAALGGRSGLPPHPQVNTRMSPIAMPVR